VTKLEAILSVCRLLLDVTRQDFVKYPLTQILGFVRCFPEFDDGGAAPARHERHDLHPAPARHVRPEARAP
jgi:hypothetical protein